MFFLRFCFVGVALVLVACGSQISNEDVSTESPSTFLQISSSSIKNGAAAGYMVFDVPDTSSNSGTVEVAVTSFASQQKHITNPEVTVDYLPDEAVSYAFFVEGVGSVLATCQRNRDADALSSSPELAGRCIHWGLLNVTFGGTGFTNNAVPTGLGTEQVASKGATLLVVPYLASQGDDSYGITENFAGIEPPANSFYKYRLIAFALRRALVLGDDATTGKPTEDQTDITNLKTTNDFKAAFGEDGQNIIIAQDNVSFNVAGKAFALYNGDGTFEHEGMLKNTVIACSNGAKSYDSPFENPGQSPQLTWENAPLSANAFVLFMMDDTSLEDAGTYSTFLGSGDERGGKVGTPTVNISQPSEITRIKTGTANCDFEYCRHWAVFNISGNARGLLRNEGVSAADKGVNKRGSVQGRHLFNGAYAIQEQPLFEVRVYDASIGETVTYTTTHGTLRITQEGSIFFTTSSTSDATRVASTAEVDATRRYFGPCAPVSDETRPVARQYTLTLLPINSDLKDWITNSGTWSTFIQRLSLNNFLYYFSPSNADKRRKRPGCPQSDLECASSPYPTRAALLSELTGGVGNAVNKLYVVHNQGAFTTFYHADDDCELCRFCLIGYDAAVPQIPLDEWRQYGY